MKIFDWVHRKFHHKEGFDRDVKKAEFVATEYTDKRALLEQVTLRGVLTIGTFGFDPLTDFNQQKECYEPDQEEEEEEEEEEENLVEYEHWNNSTDEEGDEDEDEEEGELNPLVSKAFRNGSLKGNIDSHCDGNNIENISLSPRPNIEIGLECDKKKGERITLADLFSADSENVTKKEHVGNVKQDSLKKPGPRAKDRLSFARKLIPRVKEDSRPIQKLQQLMTRMMKRKIHPDIEGGKIINQKHNYKEIQIMPNLLIMPDFKTQHHDGPANDSVSLLQTQDVMACA